MKTTRCILLIAAAMLFTVPAAQGIYAQTASPTPDPKIEKKKQELRKTSADILARLYKGQPLAKGLVEKAAGYATFSNTGVKILVGGSGRGEGVAINSKTKREVFMKMMELQAGLGFGVKKFSVILIFDNEGALNKFIDSGWEFGGQADAAAKTTNSGAAAAGAASVSPGVWMYQLTDKGVALQITVKGSKYYKDDDLNK